MLRPFLGSLKVLRRNARLHKLRRKGLIPTGIPPNALVFNNAGWQGTSKGAQATASGRTLATTVPITRLPPDPRLTGKSFDDPR